MLHSVTIMLNYLRVHNSVICCFCGCYSCFSLYRPSIIQLARCPVCRFCLMQVISRGAESLAVERPSSRLYQTWVTAEQSHWLAHWKRRFGLWCAGITAACCTYSAFANIQLCHIEMEVQETWHWLVSNLHWGICKLAAILLYHHDTWC